MRKPDALVEGFSFSATVVQKIRLFNTLYRTKLFLRQVMAIGTVPRSCLESIALQRRPILDTGC